MYQVQIIRYGVKRHSEHTNTGMLEKSFKLKRDAVAYLEAKGMEPYSGKKPGSIWVGGKVAGLNGFIFKNDGWCPASPEARITRAIQSVHSL